MCPSLSPFWKWLTLPLPCLFLSIFHLKYSSDPLLEAPTESTSTAFWSRSQCADYLQITLHCLDKCSSSYFRASTIILGQVVTDSPVVIHRIEVNQKTSKKRFYLPHPLVFSSIFCRPPIFPASAVPSNKQFVITRNGKCWSIDQKESKHSINSGGQKASVEGMDWQRFGLGRKNKQYVLRLNGLMRHKTYALSLEHVSCPAFCCVTSGGGAVWLG